MYLSSLLITAIASIVFAAESSNPAASPSSVMASMASSMKSEASKITSTAPKTVTGTETATETASTTKGGKSTNAAVAMDVGDAGVMAVLLGVAAWML